MLVVILLTILIMLLILVSIYSFYENQNLEVTHYNIHSDKIPSIFRGKQFVVLADLHNNSFGRDNERLFSEIKKVNPEFILIAGDMTVSKRGNDYSIPFSLISRLAEEFPIYYGYGNHEQRLMPGAEGYDGRFDDYKKNLEKLGVHFLENKQIKITCGKDYITITGLVLPLEFYKKFKLSKMKKEDIQNLVGIPDNQCYNIMIAHNPVYFKNYVAWGADLILSGHIHGGMVRLPVLGGVISPQYRIFPRYDAGKFEEQGKTMLVSRGLGTHTIKFRVFNRPELMVVTLERNL